MRTSHITRKLRTEAQKLNITVNRASFDQETGIAVYDFIQETDVFYQLKVSYDVDVRHYQPEFAQPLVNIANELLKKQLERLREQCEEQGVGEVEVMES